MPGLLEGFMQQQNFAQQQQANQLNIQRGQMENKALQQQQASSDVMNNMLAESLKQQVADQQKQGAQSQQQQAQQQDPSFQISQQVKAYQTAATKAAAVNPAAAAQLSQRAFDMQDMLDKRQKSQADMQKTLQATQLEKQKYEKERFAQGASAFAPLVDGRASATQEAYNIALHQAYGNDLPYDLTGDLNADMPQITEMVNSTTSAHQHQQDINAAHNQQARGQQHQDVLDTKETGRQDHVVMGINGKIAQQRKPIEAFDQKLQIASELVTQSMGRTPRPETTLGFTTAGDVKKFQEENAASYQQLHAILGNLTGSIRSGKYSGEQANKIGSLVNRTADALNKWYSGEATDTTLRDIGHMIDGLRNNVVETGYASVTRRAMDDARRMNVPEYMVEGAGAAPTTAVRIDPTDENAYRAAVNAGVKFFLLNGKVHAVKGGN